MLRIILVLAGIASAQVYENPALHGRFDVPAGWVMNTPTATPFGVQWTVTRVGLKPVSLSFMKWSTILEAMNNRSAFCFWNIKYIYDITSASTQAPLIPEIQDTIMPSGTSYAFVVIRHNESSRVLVCWSSSNQNYSQTYAYETTPSDYTTNGSLYHATWAGMSYYTPAVVAKGATSIEAQRKERLALVDLLGRRAVNSNAVRTPRFYPLR